jgi:hypothetical protein
MSEKATTEAIAEARRILDAAARRLLADKLAQQEERSA